MVRTMVKNARGGRRRGRGGIMTPVFCLLLVSTMIAGCNLDSPSTPNTPGDLTGQTTNQVFSFSGSINVSSITGTLAADDLSTITISAEVRDDAGNPVSNFTSVTFNTDLGGFLVVAGGALAVVDRATAYTSNGVAQVELQSVNRQTGVATVVASLGTTTASSTVTIEPAAVAGSVSLGFTSGTGPITMTGSASQNKPLDVTVGVLALDLAGDAISGAKVRFRIIQDTTDEGSPNDAAHWLTSSTTNTGALGDAVNILRVYGSGVIALDAELIDPVSSETIARSNRIILTTAASLIVKLNFPNGATTFTGPAPYNVDLLSAVFDATNSPQPGLQVRFTIVNDGTSGASLTTSHGTTDSQGRTSTRLRVPSTGVVTVKAGLYDATNTEIASATVTAEGQ